MYSLCPTVNKSAVVLFWVLLSRLFDFLPIMLCLFRHPCSLHAFIRSRAWGIGFFCPIFLQENLMEQQGSSQRRMSCTLPRSCHQPRYSDLFLAVLLPRAVLSDGLQLHSLVFVRLVQLMLRALCLQRHRGAAGQQAGSCRPLCSCCVGVWVLLDGELRCWLSARCLYLCLSVFAVRKEQQVSFRGGSEIVVGCGVAGTGGC